MSTEIKPCPFCGLNHCFIDGMYGRHFVQCENTLCNYVSGFRVTESKAIEAHNQFASLREENKRLRGPDPCDVCAGDPNMKNCICDGDGTIYGELTGFRKELVTLLEENERLRKKLNGASRFIEFCKAWSWIPENPEEGDEQALNGDNND